MTEDNKPHYAQALKDEVASLKAELAAERASRTADQKNAHLMASSTGFTGTAEEQPSGNFRTESICQNPWERNVKKLKYEDVDLPLYFYNIQLPAGCGVSLMTNGLDVYHGQTVEVSQHELADLKSRVAACWNHEKSIHGENENAYRRPDNKHLISASALRNRMAH